MVIKFIAKCIMANLENQYARLLILRRCAKKCVLEGKPKLQHTFFHILDEYQNTVKCWTDLNRL